jgi:ornithine carbamoyltransferase
MKDYLRIGDLSVVDLAYLLDMATQAKLEPFRHRDFLSGRIVFCYFAKPSTRTRVSFAAAIAHLGGEAEFVGPDELQLGRGETIEDTAAVVSRYAAAAVIRTFAHEDVVRFAAAASVPVINALTDLHHPCQALADLLTLRHHFHRLAGLRLAYVGAGNNVAHSLIEAAALAGVDLIAATPDHLRPHLEIVERAGAVARRVGGSITLTDDPVLAVKGADAVYTDVWLSMGDPPEEQAARRRLLEPYRVTPDLMALAGPEAVFLHCLPAHRGDEVTEEVIDGPQSVVVDQAENRLHTEQALLFALLVGCLHGGDK